MAQVIDFTQRLKERKAEKEKQDFLLHLKIDILPYLSFSEKEQLIETIDNEDKERYEALIVLALKRNMQQKFREGKK